MRRWLLALAFLMGCEPEVPPDEEKENKAPIARMQFSQIQLRETPVAIDATQSEDPDGEIVRATLIWGDGSPAHDDVGLDFTHLYASAGSYQVRLEVEDDDGEVVSVSGEVILTADDPGEVCSCILLCPDDGICTATGCERAVSSDDDEDPNADFTPIDCGS